MKKKGFTAGQVIRKLREAGVPQPRDHAWGSQPNAWHHGAYILSMEEGVGRDPDGVSPQAQRA
jgi:hypothetical protein